MGEAEVGGGVVVAAALGLAFPLVDLQLELLQDFHGCLFLVEKIYIQTCLGIFDIHNKSLQKSQ